MCVTVCMLCLEKDVDSKDEASSPTPNLSTHTSTHTQVREVEVEEEGNMTRMNATRINTPRVESRTPRQTPRGDGHTPRVESHTPRQTPRGERVTPRMDEVHSHTPQQTPRAERHTPRADGGVDDDEIMASLLSQRTSVTTALSDRLTHIKLLSIKWKAGDPSGALTHLDQVNIHAAPFHCLQVRSAARCVSSHPKSYQ